MRTWTSGSPHVRIALVDGPIARSHPCLRNARIVESGARRLLPTSLPAITHATGLASLLVGQGEAVIGLCPACTLLSIPIVDEDFEQGRLAPEEAAERIAEAIVVAVSQNASVIQLSLDFSPDRERPFTPVVEALGYAARRGIRTVIAAGNQGILGSSAVLSAPGVVPVAMSDENGEPHPSGTLGMTIGTRGLLAPGNRLLGAVPPDGTAYFTGSSYAACFVTGAFALLCALNPAWEKDAVWEALLLAGRRTARPHSLVPPLLNGALALDRLVGRALEQESHSVWKL